MKNTPGPLAPPVKRRPRRKMTALSYSCITNLVYNLIHHNSSKWDLDNLDCEEERHRESDEDEEKGTESDQTREDTGAVITHLINPNYKLY